MGRSMASIPLLLLAMPLVLNVVLAENCGPNAGGTKCQSGYCCSKWGYCGTTNDYCGTDCASQCPSSPPSTPAPTPSGCYKKNGISTGWLPDEDDGGTMKQISDILGPNLGKACYYGLYSQILSTTYDDRQLTARMPDIKASGAILQAAVMPTKVRFSQITPNLAGQIANSMKKFTDNGITVWLRFAHEVNWYVRPESGPTYAGGTPTEFITAWRNVANAVKGNPKVKMFWSPNEESDVNTLTQWWPGPAYVDIVGIDIYPKGNKISSFAATYGSFIDKFSTPYSKPFVVGETGATDDASKRTWLNQLVSPQSLSKYPTYQGWAWFEYLKGVDFRVVTSNNGIAKSILS